MARLAVAFAASAAVFAYGAARAESPRASVQGDLDGNLREAIAAAIGETDKPIASRFEARRRAREASESAIAVLRSEGYYANEVEADVGEGDTPTAVVRVTPGARFNIAEPAIEWLEEPPLPEVQLAGEAVMGLATGQAGRAADVIGAEGRIVASAQKRGYADVVAGDRLVVVDHADKTVRPTFRINSGALVRLDGMKVVGGERTNRQWLQRLAPWRPGDVYDPEDVGELERRLLDTGVYDSVTVALAGREDATADGLRPVVVSLADRSRRTLEVAASYSTSEGAGVDARWTRYNILGRADTISYFGRVSELDSRLGAEITFPHWRRPQQTLKALAQGYDVKTDAYDERGVGVRADVQRRFGKTSFVTLGGSVDYSQTDETQRVQLTSIGSELVTIATLAAVSLDRSDDPLDPKRGWRLEARAEPTYLLGDRDRPYVKVQSQVSTYLPFGAQARTVLAGRLKAGLLAGATAENVPASRRFYSGGGGSVRGYAYQAIGPRLLDNTPDGGASLLEASFEVRQKIGEKWGVVLFADGGAVGTDEFPSGDDFSAGVGIGVRYDLGFGPIRADIAIPLDKREGDPSFQIYLSIGQSF